MTKLLIARDKTRTIGLLSPDYNFGAIQYWKARLKIARMDHLDVLEAESIYILREVAAEFSRPAMLYSIGKDSSVLLRLAQKAFYPAELPFPLLHIDTTYKFTEMIAFRDRVARELGVKLIVHINQDAINDGANPFR